METGNKNAPRDLREFISRLEAAGELERWPQPLSFRDIARVIEASDKAILIERPVGYSMPILANAMASRRVWSIALGVDEAELLAEVKRRLGRRIAPVRVSSGPVKEVIELGEKTDLTSFPAYLQHELDGAPYISAAMDVTRHPGTSGYNIGGADDVARAAGDRDRSGLAERSAQQLSTGPQGRGDPLPDRGGHRQSSARLYG